MKVLLVNGSSKPQGCTFTALSEVTAQLNKEGIETEIFNLGASPVRDCIGCGACKNLDCKCTFDDDVVNELIKKAKESDGFIFGTPVYYAHPTGRILSVLDRAFFAGKAAFAHKPGSVVSSARRAGTTASFDVLHKYLSISQMPIVTSTYWNMVHGNTPDEVQQDLEGMQTMRNLGRNMAWMLKAIEAAKDVGVDIPEAETDAKTSFIR